MYGGTADTCSGRGGCPPPPLLHRVWSFSLIPRLPDLLNYTRKERELGMQNHVRDVSTLPIKNQY